MIWLTKEQIISLHHDLVISSGGSTGIRDEGLLESAIFTPLQTFNSKELFPGIISKSARLAYGLTTNHPFIDGNKRIGAHAMLITLKLNHFSLTYSQKELSDTFLDLASGQLSCEQLHQWIIQHLENEEP